MLLLPLWEHACWSLIVLLLLPCLVISVRAGLMVVVVSPQERSLSVGRSGRGAGGQLLGRACTPFSGASIRDVCRPRDRTGLFCQAAGFVWETAILRTAEPAPWCKPRGLPSLTIPHPASPQTPPTGISGCSLSPEPYRRLAFVLPPSVPQQYPGRAALSGTLRPVPTHALLMEDRGAWRRLLNVLLLPFCWSNKHIGLVFTANIYIY